MTGCFHACRRGGGLDSLICPEWFMCSDLSGMRLMSPSSDPESQSGCTVSAGTRELSPIKLLECLTAVKQ